MIQRKFGYIRDIGDFRDFKYSNHLEYKSAQRPPPSIDLRGPALPPIKDQGDIGSCVANGTASALEFIQLKAIREKLKEPEVFHDTQYNPLSRLFIYWNARTIDGDNQVDGGTQIRSAIMSIRQKGVCQEARWPYGKSYLFREPSPEANKEGAFHKVLSAFRLDNIAPIQLETCLAAGFPFILGLSLYSSFERVGNDGIVPMPHKDDSLIGGHCMTAVGYERAKGHFIIANSWGPSWGDKGFCYIPYQYVNSHLGSDFWTIRLE